MLTLLSSMAPREALQAMAVGYHSITAQPVAVASAGGVEVARRVQNGEAVDIVVLSSNAIELLIAAGKLLPGSRVDLMKSGIAVAVRAGRPRPEIDSEAAVKRAVLGARTLSYSTGPSGVYLEQLFERWGILGAVRDRIVVPPPGVPVGTLVADGAAELGFQQSSELLNVPGIDVAGPLPPAIQSMTVFSAGVGTGCVDPEAAHALLNYMHSPATAEVKRRHGMEAE